MKRRILQSTVVACAVSLLAAGDLLAASAGSMSVASLPDSVIVHPPGFHPEPVTSFDRYLATDIPPADGFDFPVGDPDGWGSYVDSATGKPRTGWHVYIRYCQRYSYGIHPGEDWNGAGSGNSDLGLPVYAIATGRVVFAEPNVKPAGGIVILQHVFYENHQKRRIRSVYKHLDGLRIETGQVVDRRQVIGYVGRGSNNRYLAHLHFELRWDESLGPTYWPSARKKSLAWIQEHYAPPSAFIRSHRRLFVPQREERLVLIDPSAYRMRLYEGGAVAGELPVGFGFTKGSKPGAWTNRLPQGMYFVVDRHRGLTGGDFGKRLDGTRLRVNFPNKFDAARGRAGGLILPQDEASIASAWVDRRATSDKTLLSRGIGFQGWIQEWEPAQPRNHYWGSLLLYHRDIETVYDRIPLGTMVVIF